MGGRELSISHTAISQGMCLAVVLSLCLRILALTRSWSTSFASPSPPSLAPAASSPIWARGGALLKGAPLAPLLSVAELLQAALLHELLQRIALDTHGTANAGRPDLPGVNELPEGGSGEVRVGFRLLVVEPRRRNRGLFVTFGHEYLP